MYLTRLFLDDPPQREWPFTLPPVAQLAADGLELPRPVTFLVGENGSGKSTLVEAVADLCGISSEGGKAGTRYSSTGARTPLGQALRGEFTSAGLKLLTGPRSRRAGFFLRAETLFNLAQNVSGRYGFWDADLTEQSHGEGLMTVLDAMVTRPGLYLMDEPEAALSFTSCLNLIAQMDRLARAGAQIICATHSPVLTALPGAQILELGEHGIRPSSWEELPLTDHFRRYLTKPDLYLRRILNN
ncbi:ABC transporter [Actinocorallia sp. API 0066]|uniref:AAA family ATPase n=1 Tax=Actinocorallia sp. API 0066 TaxID=2896846 RepID=UPI001E5AB54C|nr:AAA family ATPase [Actinocorallia sp. API 0066]MCD0452526.1 ABC transporter [Actinocorallia sp. API 0066]